METVDTTLDEATTGLLKHIFLSVSCSTLCTIIDAKWFVNVFGFERGILCSRRLGHFIKLRDLSRRLINGLTRSNRAIT